MTKILSPIQKFINAESFSGILLFGVTILAMALANSPLQGMYESFWEFEIGIKSESFSLIKPLILWINDGLMAIFFFLVGLEIKREVLVGELNSIKKASLPIFAAIGGMLIPIAIFFISNKNPETSGGWGISMATDIAFTLAILQLFGKRIPIGLKIFLTAFAIIDDIGAVLVIALFYSGDIYWNLIIYSSILLAILYFLSYKKVHSKYLIVFFGIIIWILFLKSGIHPTLAGILLAFAVPIRQKINEFEYVNKLQKIVAKITAQNNTNKLPILTKKQISQIDYLEEWTDKVQSPLQLLEHRLHSWVAYLIMPIFAFANAGINFTQNFDIDFSLASNIILALVIGKTLGVSLFSYISIKLKIASLPKNVTLFNIFGVAVLSGLGFTMSLFIGNLAFYNQAELLNSAKTGIIIASVIAGVFGYIILYLGTKKSKQDKPINNDL